PCLGLRLREPLQRRRRLCRLPAGQDRPAVRAAVDRDNPQRRVQAALGWWRVSVGRALAQVPVRLRLTLAFAVVMAALLSATGLFLYLRLGSALDRGPHHSPRPPPP